MPGYWNKAASGYQWVGGYWGPAANPAQVGRPETVYYPAPPASVESGASTAAPSPDHFWVPGHWYWVDGRYVWRAGYWSRCQPDWVWIPARYVWTPGGYIFLPGHWDYALPRRGVVFCPVYFANPYYVAPTYYYTPSICIETPVLTTCLFCRPAYCHYYFGDYYDPMYVRVGIYPWYAVHEGHHCYEPLFVYDRWYYGRRDPGWVVALHRDYDYRVAHIDARPPHTYVAAVGFSIRTPGATLSLAVPVARVAARGGEMHFEHLNAERRQQFVRAEHEIHEIRNERRNQEFKANVQAHSNGGGQPVRMNATEPGRPINAGTMGPSSQTSKATGHVGNGGTAVASGAAQKTNKQKSSKSDTSAKHRGQHDRDKDQGGR